MGSVLGTVLTATTTRPLLSRNKLSSLTAAEESKMDYAAMVEIWGWASTAQKKQDQHILLKTRKNKYLH